MIKKGIQRINITDKATGSGAWRFNVASKYYADIHQIYRMLFPTLLPGNEFLDCTAQEKLGRYDIDFGVDLIFNYVNGHSSTIQEKILTTVYNTVTVEYYQNPKTMEPGDWFKLKCDYYFVGYGKKEAATLDRWILLDWNQVRLHSAAINWGIRENKYDGAKASFKYADFTSFPDNCVVGMYLNGKLINNASNCSNFYDLQFPLM
jgi:hypothetical protein